jgi:RES domain-containing protein
MKPKAYANYESVKEALSFLTRSSRPWSGICYRATSFRYAEEHDFLSGGGSFLHGGRFIAPRVSEVVHLSASPELSLSERALLGSVGTESPSGRRCLFSSEG